MNERTIKYLRYIPLAIMLAAAVTGGIFLLTNKSITAESVYDFICTLSAGNLHETTGAKSIGAALAASGVILLLYAVKGVSGMILYDVLVIASALVFPFPYALLLNTLGTALCFSVSYFIGHTSGAQLNGHLLEKNGKLKKLYEENKSNLTSFCIIARLMNFQSEVLGLVFGSLKMHYGKFMLVSMLCQASGMVTFTLLGRDLDILSLPFLLSAGISVAISAAALIRIAGRRKRAAENSTEPTKH